MLLPAAFRSLSRPSSASGAKASALCSYSLNLLSHSFVKIFWYSSRLLKLKLLPFSFFKKTNFLLISLSLSLFLYSVFMVRNSAYKCAVVGLGGLEPPTSRLSGVRSNQLSYKPILSIDYYIVHDNSHFDKCFFYIFQKNIIFFSNYRFNIRSRRLIS